MGAGYQPQPAGAGNMVFHFAAKLLNGRWAFSSQATVKALKLWARKRIENPRVGSSILSLGTIFSQ
jgi:hypothetical protein